jgi:hypothetical protein
MLAIPYLQRLGRTGGRNNTAKKERVSLGSVVEVVAAYQSNAKHYDRRVARAMSLFYDYSSFLGSL